MGTCHILQNTSKAIECWKPVDGFPNYLISNAGRLMNKYGKILKPRRQNSGYLFYTLYDGRGRKHQTQRTVHRLVAEHFIPNYNCLSDVNHIDNDKDNNIVTNLEWLSHSDNAKHSFATNKRRKTRKGFKQPKPFWHTMYRKKLIYWEN